MLYWKMSKLEFAGIACSVTENIVEWSYSALSHIFYGAMAVVFNLSGLG